MSHQQHLNLVQFYSWGREGKSGLVTRRVSTVISNSEVAYTGDLKPCDGRRVMRCSAQSGLPVIVAETCEDGVDRRLFRTDEIRVTRLGGGRSSDK